MCSCSDFFFPFSKWIHHFDVHPSMNCISCLDWVLGVHVHFKNGFILHSLHLYTFLIWSNTHVQETVSPAHGWRLLPVAHDQHLLPATQWSLPLNLAEQRHVLGTCGGAVVYGRDYSYIMCSTPPGAFHVAAGRKVFGWRGHAVCLDMSMNGLAQTPSGDCCDVGRGFCCNGITLRPRDSRCAL